MNNDTAIVLLLTDLQRQIERLKNDNAALQTHIATLEAQTVPQVNIPKE